MSDIKIQIPENFKNELEKLFNNKFNKNTDEDLEKDKQQQKKKQKEAKKVIDFKFDYTPKMLKEYLDKYIISQEEAKKALSIAVCDHYKHLTSKNPKYKNRDYIKQNILITGPTGVGKTLMIKQLAKLIDVPFIKADATRFSETGYMGANVDDLIKDLVSVANGDKKKAECGIVYLDEVDKLASYQNGQKDVNGRGVQLGLLKLMEDSEVDLRSGNDPASQMQAFMDFQRKGKSERDIISTKNILFIMSGAFHGLEKFFRQRQKNLFIGFDSKKLKKTVDFTLATEDFIKYGMEPEFMGRVPVRVACYPLGHQDLVNILQLKNYSIIEQYKDSFANYDIELTFTNSALEEIARRSLEQKTGARGIFSIIEKILRDFKFYLPSTEVKKLLIDEEVIKNPKVFLSGLLDEKISPDVFECIKKIEEHILEKFSTEVVFAKDAVHELNKVCNGNTDEIKKYYEDKLIMCLHSLKFIQNKKALTKFIINKDIIVSPVESLEKLVKASLVSSNEINC
jgi:ATP-dependent Clp protease ATP-binding subunit ClpX